VDVGCQDGFVARWGSADLWLPLWKTWPRRYEWLTTIEHNRLRGVLNRWFTSPYFEHLSTGLCVHDARIRLRIVPLPGNTHPFAILSANDDGRRVEFGAPVTPIMYVFERGVCVLTTAVHATEETVNALMRVLYFY
ncbi:Hypothetical protein UVM_LOCUS207, partial [uncultured virus]